MYKVLDIVVLYIKELSLEDQLNTVHRGPSSVSAQVLFPSLSVFQVPRCVLAKPISLAFYSGPDAVLVFK